MNTTSRSQTVFVVLACLTAGATAQLAAGQIPEPPIEDLFALRLLLPDDPQPGEDLEAVVEAYHPYTGEPLRDLEIRAAFASHDLGKTKVRGRTDDDGEAVLSFAVPDDFYGTVDVAAEATWNGRTRQVDHRLFLGGDADSVVLSTDKKLYRPGQTFHVRGLWLSNRRAMAGEDVELTVYGPRGDVVFEAENETSAFGVAAFEWNIPETASHGSYLIAADPPVFVEIRDFEPAPFLLRVEPRRSFDLASTESIFDVRITTPAGEPLAGVEVTVEEDDEWALVLREPAITDADGRAVLRFDVASNEDVDEKYEISFQVNAHDPRSLRTETQEVRHFVTPEAVDVRVVGTTPFQGQPAYAWVVTTWADGRPVPCRVELRDNDDEPQSSHIVTTDKNGVARVPKELPFDDVSVLATALEPWNGKDGTWTGSTEWDDVADALLIVPDRALLRPGDRISGSVYAENDLAGRSVRVEIADAGQDIVLADSKARFDFPWNPAFRGPVRIRARLRGVDVDDADSLETARATVLFPASGEDFQLSLAADRETYRPGEEARLALTVDPPVPAVAAVAVVDGAVEERQQSLGLSRGPALLAMVDLLYEERAVDHGVTEIAGWTVPSLAWALGDAEERQRNALESLAAALLHDYGRWSPWDKVDVSSPVGEEKNLYQDLLDIQWEPVQTVLQRFLRSEGPEPASDTASWRDFLDRHGVDADGLHDPWGSAYCFHYSFLRDQRVLTVRSAGRDRRWETFDDLDVQRWSWQFARGLKADAERAMNRYYETNGSFILDQETLAQELARDGIDWWTQHDPWGRPYRVAFKAGTYEPRLTVQVISSGPDGDDDVIVAQASFHYGRALIRRFQELLQDHMQRGGKMPHDSDTLRAALGDAFDDLLDPWGQNLLYKFSQRQVYTPLDMETAQEQTLVVIDLKSAGADGQPETGDDHALGKVDEPFITRAVNVGAILGPKHGLMMGDVNDDTGAPLPGVTITIDQRGSGRSWIVHTDAYGRFQLDLPNGVYDVVAQLEGFSEDYASSLAIRHGKGLYVEFLLEVARVNEYLTVSYTMAGMPMAPPSKMDAEPRLRKDFLETLLWLPELSLEDGRADVLLPLADNVTTWKVAALASTADGRISTAVHDVPATLPFYLAPDLPYRLTAGDEVDVPVDLHNRSGETLDVTFTSSGFKQLLSVTTDDVKRLAVPRRFEKPGEVALRFDARSPQGPADAVERKVHVFFDGVERTRTSNVLHDGVPSDRDLENDFPSPPAALPGSERFDVVLYEDLGDHLTAALTEMRRRPTGCAEQTTSMAWINLLLVDALEARGEGDSEAAAEARDDLAHGVESLRLFHNGGFAYWELGSADIALTAYVLDFLHEAQRHVEVDEELVAGAAAWLGRRSDRGGRRTRAWTALALARLDEGDEELAETLSEEDDPYILALTVLALEALGEENAGVQDRLAALAEDGHWAKTSATPFYGRGRAAALETTALAVRALASSKAHARLRDETLAWLLKNKDASGAWSSTQTTAQVLRALSGMLTEASVQKTLVQKTLSWYEPWATLAPPPAGLTFTAGCSPTVLQRGEDVTCDVRVRRLADGGMMIAEIGLPPGADVDEWSLAEVVEDGGALSRYEVLPDRVVFYLWPTQDETAWSFRWRPRLTMRARSAPSRLYDYYNPNEEVLLKPLDFQVKE